MELRPALFETWATQALGMGVYSDPRFPPSPYYRFLRVLAANLHPRLSVELGLCGGGGSLHLALGWPDGMVVGVENSLGDAFQQGNWAYLERTCPNFRRWYGDSVESAEFIAYAYGAVDILFVDTVHTYSWTMAELAAWRSYLSRGAVVCLDDLFRPGMDRVWAEAPGEKIRLDVLHSGAEVGGGFGVLWNI